MIEIMRLRNMIGVTQVTQQRSLFTSSDAQKITTLLQDKYYFFIFFDVFRNRLNFAFQRLQLLRFTKSENIWDIYFCNICLLVDGLLTSIV